MHACNAYKTFVVPYDYSVHSRAALFAATDLARHLNADLHLVHVLQAPGMAVGYDVYGAAPAIYDMRELRHDAEHALASVATEIECAPGRVEAHVVEGASVAATLLEIAEKLHADLIVMGTHGRTGLAHVFLGSVAERTLRRATCPVLTVQGPEVEAHA